MQEPTISFAQFVLAEQNFTGTELNEYRISVPGLQEPGPLSLSNERYDPLNIFRQALNKVTSDNITAIMNEVTELIVADPLEMARVLFDKAIEEPSRAYVFFTVVSKKEDILRKFIYLCHQDHTEAISVNVEKIEKLVDGGMEDVETEDRDSFYNYCRRKSNMMKLVASVYTLGLIRINIVEQCRKELVDILLSVHDETKKFSAFVSEEEASKWSPNEHDLFVEASDRLYGGMLCSLISSGLVETGARSVGKTEIAIKNTLYKEDFARQVLEDFNKFKDDCAYEHTAFTIDTISDQLSKYLDTL